MFALVGAACVGLWWASVNSRTPIFLMLASLLVLWSGLWLLNDGFDYYAGWNETSAKTYANMSSKLITAHCSNGTMDWAQFPALVACNDVNATLSTDYSFSLSPVVINETKTSAIVRTKLRDNWVQVLSIILIFLSLGSMAWVGMKSRREAAKESS